MSYENIWKDNGLHRKFSGMITGQEILSSNLSLHGDDRFKDMSYIINDFTQIDNFMISDSDISKIASLDITVSVYSKQIKIIIVATNKNLVSWAELYLNEMKESSFECVIVEDLESALKNIH